MINIFNKKVNSYTLCLVLLVSSILFFGCSRHRNRVSNPNDAPPHPVSNISVKNIHGGAIIYYDLPQDQNLLYVKAVWTTKSQGKMVEKSSFYKDSLIVDGFINSSPHTVKLYSYSRGLNPSKVREVTVHPLTPSFKVAYNSINIWEAFGGIGLSYRNPDSSAIVITVLAKDKFGRFSPLYRKYTSAVQDTFYVRGLKSKPQRFGYYVRNRFRNRSDTTYTTLKPILEVLLDKSKFSNARFPMDDWRPRFGAFRLMWNNKAPWAPNTYWQSKFTPLPFFVTIDLGQLVKIDRIVLYGWPGRSNFARKFPYKYEFWGSQNPVIGDGIPFDSSWFKYGTFISTPPSGQYPPTQQDIDSQYPQGGDVTVIPNAADFPPTRYLRMRFLQSWGGEDDIMIAEIDIYGQPVDSIK